MREKRVCKRIGHTRRCPICRRATMKKNYFSAVSGRVPKISLNFEKKQYN
jgi:hypothetical protein